MPSGTYTTDWIRFSDGGSHELPTSIHVESFDSLKVRFRGVDRTVYEEASDSDTDVDSREITTKGEHAFNATAWAPEVPDGYSFERFELDKFYEEEFLVDGTLQSDEEGVEEPGDPYPVNAHYYLEEEDLPVTLELSSTVTTVGSRNQLYQTIDPAITVSETSDTASYDGTLQDEEESDWYELAVDPDDVSLSISLPNSEKRVDVQIEYTVSYHESVDWRTVDFGEEAAPSDSIWWWRGYRFTVPNPITAIGLYGGHTAAGLSGEHAYVGVYEVDEDDVPQEIVAYSEVTDERRQFYEIDPVSLEPSKQYIIAQGATERGDGHYLVDVDDPPWLHPHIDDVHPDSTDYEVYRWETGGDQNEILDLEPEIAQAGTSWSPETSTPDIGIRFVLEERPDAVAIVELEADGEVVQLPLVDSDDEQLEHDGVETVHPDDPEQVLAVDLVAPEDDEASTVELPTSDGVLAWREHQE